MTVQAIKGKAMVQGVILILIGLLTGFAVAALTNPRMGVAAHVEAIMGGIILIVFGGILVERMHCSAKLITISWFSLLLSLYGNYALILLASIWGTSMTMPIAGNGFRAVMWKESIVALGLLLCNGAILTSLAIVITGLVKHNRQTR